MQKGYLSPVIAIILIVLIIGGLFYVKSTNRTSSILQTSSTVSTPQPSSDSSTQLDYAKDWSIYTNESFHFTFKYPKDWQLTKPSLEGLHPNNKTLLQINLTNPSYDKNKILSSDFGGPGDHPSNPDKDPYAITFMVWDNKERKSLKEKLIEVDKFFQNSQQGFCLLLPESDSATEHQRCVKNGSDIGMNEKIFATGNYIYLLSGGPINSRADYMFKQITDTFKLTQ